MSTIPHMSLEKIVEEPSPLPAATIMQFLLLYKRNLLTTKRTYVSICINLFK